MVKVLVPVPINKDVTEDDKYLSPFNPAVPEDAEVPLEPLDADVPDVPEVPVEPEVPDVAS